MKITAALMLVASLFASVSALAQGDSCKKISGLAGEAMTARQNGELLEDAMEKVGDGSKFAKNVLMNAYERPVVADKAGRQQAISEFQNEAYRACYNANN